eukprot:TRINITY_DN30808_c0_g1_i3.p1 TRINITY_DN30808_c0_g1~~TRINITY_DN30808_c0_g1_i3.p1  ORF type:complete len:178 (+),score=34.30 TRINITY_DN30808_c0_g1_i3:158-691(+)
MCIRDRYQRRVRGPFFQTMEPLPAQVAILPTAPIAPAVTPYDEAMDLLQETAQRCREAHVSYTPPPRIRGPLTEPQEGLSEPVSDSVGERVGQILRSINHKAEQQLAEVMSRPEQQEATCALDRLRSSQAARHSQVKEKVNRRNPSRHAFPCQVSGARSKTLGLVHFKGSGTVSRQQ